VTASAPAPDLSKLRINRDVPPPVRRAFVRNVVILVVAVALVAAVVVVMRQRAVVPVQVITVQATSGNPGSASGGGASVTANGYVVARTRAAVSAKVPGRLAYLGVSEGSVVNRGDIIARLENADYDAQVAQADANLASLRTQLVEAQTERDQLERDAKRLRDMRSQNPRLISAQEIEQADSRLAQSDARVKSAQARIDAAAATLRFAHASFENTVIRAPFSGTVLKKEAEVGEVVAPSVGGGLTRGAVVTIADLKTLEVEVDVNEAYIARVKKGQPARIQLDAYPDTSFRGQVRQVVPTADRQRATVQVKVSILDRDPRILPEMGSRVDFLEPDTTARQAGAPRAPAPARIRLPAAAVRELGGQSVVWLVRQNKLEPRVVDAAPVSGGFREVRGGLAGGEQVMVGGVASPQAGMRVKVATTP
jgi:RND family efflux transporter MFP subunit